MHEQVDFHSWPSSLPALESAWELLRQAIRERLIPGASAAVYWKARSIRFAAGHALRAFEATFPVQLDTLYDCASLTKVTATLPLILMLLDSGTIQLEDRVSDYVSGFKRTDKQDITIRQLLAHTSGLKASIPLTSNASDHEQCLRILSDTPLIYKPGTCSVYSDLGFILLGFIAEELTELPLNLAADSLIFNPLGMQDTCYLPSAELRPRIAATEIDTESGCYWHGTVHDENARAMGGVSGHAGLFSTSADLLRYSQQWLDPSVSLLSPKIIRMATSTHTPVLPNLNRGLGWVLHGDSRDLSGPLLTPAAFGHTGFTGTSIYIDPHLQLAVVLLTNRVHYGRDRDITELRTHFHTAVANALTHS